MYHPANARAGQLNNDYCTGFFRTADGVYFDLEDETSSVGVTGYTNILDWLQGRTAGLQVYSIRMARIPFLRNRPAAVFVDEIRVDPGYLSQLPVADIAFVKVIKTPFLGSIGSGNGAIAVYTKRGEEGDEESEEASL